MPSQDMQVKPIYGTRISAFRLLYTKSPTLRRITAPNTANRFLLCFLQADVLCHSVRMQRYDHVPVDDGTITQVSVSACIDASTADSQSQENAVSC